MTGRSRRTLLAVLALGMASVLLAGCPKASVPGPGAGLGSGAGTASTDRGAGSGPGVGAGGAGAQAGGGPEAAGVGAGGAGTTLPALPSPHEFSEASQLKDLHFDFDQYAIRPQDKRILDADADWLVSHREALVLIEGHADERGTNEYNLALGERRAKATRDELVARGVAASRITIIPYGEERPACRGHFEGCWFQNRRTHFLVKAS